MKLKIGIYTKLIIIISSLISICLVVFIAINANYYITRMSRNNAELYSAYRISELLKSFRSNITILDNKQKGYIITGDGKFLEEYKLKETETKVYLKNMEKYFSGKAEEEAFYKLKDLTYKKLSEAKDLSQGNNLAGFKARTDDNEEVNGNTVDEIKFVIEDINGSLNKKTQILLDNSIEYVKISKNWSFLEVAIGIIAALAALIILFRDINVRNKLENELRIAKRQADDNALTKEQFMANMSHEIRTPMNAILGFSNLLQKTRLDNAQTEYLSAIKTSGSNLLSIINDILDFSKIEAGKLHIEKISFDLLGLLDSLKIMFAEKAKEKEIGFEVAVDEQLPQFVFGDPTRLTQILVNLTNNAIKFTSKGNVKLSCEFKSLEQDVVQLVFRIKDTGIGIPADKVGDVFERFNQGNKETTRNYGGTGLGLAIVKNLVEVQNGEISLKSKEGVGTEFSITIGYPISYENTYSELNINQLHLPKISNGQLRVLLAEDNALNQKLAANYLKSFGMEVDVAENGQIALDYLQQRHYDIILMDIQMPVLDGYSAAVKIRSELHLDTPVIAMTAHIMSGEREKCISFGMNDYISKPFKEADLHAVIIKYIGHSQTTDTNKPDHLNHQKTAMNDTPKVVNLKDLYDLARGNNSFIKEMIDIFLEQNPIDLSHIERAIPVQDFAAIRAASHKMKTSLGFMGMKPLLTPLSEMEMLAENKQDLPRITAIYNEIRSNCEAATHELNDVLATMGKEA